MMTYSDFQRIQAEERLEEILLYGSPDLTEYIEQAKEILGEDYVNEKIGDRLDEMEGL